MLRYEPTDAGVDHALLDREVTAVLHIPRRFEEDLVRRGRAPVQLVLNAEEGATAGIVQSYALSILAAYAAELDRTLPRLEAMRTARVAPLDLRTQRWFNPTRNYKHWMVPALMVSLTTIIGLLLTAQNITRENELGTLEQLNVTPMTKVQFIAAKLIPFWLLSLVIFTIGLTIGKLVFGIPMRGNLLLVYLAAMAYLVVVLGLGLWISTITRTQQQAMFVAFFVILIFLLMSGLFTPVDSMPRLGTVRGRGEPGEALRGGDAGRAGAGSRAGDGGEADPGARRGGHRRSGAGGGTVSEVGGLGLPNCHPERSEGS